MPLITKLTKFTTASPVVITADFVSNATGTNFLILYAAGGVDSTTKKYFLTSDSAFTSDNDNFNTTATGNFTFDLEIIKPFTVAAGTTFISFLQFSNADTTTTVVTIHHVTSGGTESSLGAATALNSNTGGSNWERKGLTIPTTRRKFNKGEKLRISVDPTMVGIGEVYWDPSGRFTVGETNGGATVNSTFKISIPIEGDE